MTLSAPSLPPSGAAVLPEDLLLVPDHDQRRHRHSVPAGQQRRHQADPGRAAGNLSVQQGALTTLTLVVLLCLVTGFSLGALRRTGGGQRGLPGRNHPDHERNRRPERGADGGWSSGSTLSLKKHHSSGASGHVMLESVAFVLQNSCIAAVAKDHNELPESRNSLFRKMFNF